MGTGSGSKPRITKAAAKGAAAAEAYGKWAARRAKLEKAFQYAAHCVRQRAADDDDDDGEPRSCAQLEAALAERQAGAELRCRTARLHSILGRTLAKMTKAPARRSGGGGSGGTHQAAQAGVGLQLAFKASKPVAADAYQRAVAADDAATARIARQLQARRGRILGV